MKKLLNYLRCIRYDEVLLLSGIPILGLSLTVAAGGRFTVSRLLLFGVAAFFLLAHTYVFNDWAGQTSEIADNRHKQYLDSRALFNFAVFLGLAALAAWSFEHQP